MSRPLQWLLATTGLLLALVQASTLTPPVLPLAVRNPYLSTWLPNARDSPWNKWPMFWTGQQVGMSIMASVPGSKTVYPLLGRPHDSLDAESDGYSIGYPLYLGASYDASTTNLTYNIPSPHSDGKAAKLVVSFLSPITPESSMRQSIPASYVSISAHGNFDIDVYMDLNGDWVSGNAESKIKWYIQSVEFDETGSLWSWQVEKEEEQEFVELNDRSEWGRMHFTGPPSANYASGSSFNVRRTFAERSKLTNEAEQNFRSISEDEPVFAFHQHFKLGSANNTSADVLFTITHIQDEIVQYASARGLTYMRPLWKSWFFSEYTLIMFHYIDYHTAKKLANKYSVQLEHDAYKSGGSDYVDIVALSARQVLGATSFSGTPEAPMIFLKEISSNGNTQTVDVIFPAFPFFLYTNPRWLAYLLEPLLEHQLSGQYPNKYSMHDLGAHFPNLTGHFDGRDEYMPVEECGDMLIMGLALVNSLKYATASTAQSVWSVISGSHNSAPVNLTAESVFPLQISGKGSDIYGLDDTWGGEAKGGHQAKRWLSRSYPIWKQWTEYLIDEALEPANQLCTDDFAGWLPLQTNLALKGIVGIRAMSELASIVGQTSEAKYYRNISEVYIDKWMDFGLTRDKDHAKLAYDWYGSWTTLYSLYADAQLCFHTGDDASSTPAGMDDHQHPLVPASNKSSNNFIPTSIYVNQSQHYTNVMQRYGLPLDSRHLLAKSDWMMQVAAVATKPVRKELYARYARWINETDTDLPLTDIFETEGNGGFGSGIRFTARPVVGSHFARLVLERACDGAAARGLEALDAY